MKKQIAVGIIALGLLIHGLAFDWREHQKQRQLDRIEEMLEQQKRDARNAEWDRQREERKEKQRREQEKMDRGLIDDDWGYSYYD